MDERSTLTSNLPESIRALAVKGVRHERCSYLRES